MVALIPPIDWSLAWTIVAAIGIATLGGILFYGFLFLITLILDEFWN